VFFACIRPKVGSPFRFLAPATQSPLSPLPPKKHREPCPLSLGESGINIKLSFGSCRSARFALIKIWRMLDRAPAIFSSRELGAVLPAC
jgi:hypothetical protein